MLNLDQSLSTLMFLILSTLITSAPALAIEQEKRICDDLYAAACLNPENKNKHVLDLQKYRDKAQKAVNEARKKALQKLGFDSLLDALKEKLETKGLKLAQNVNSQQFDDFALENSLQKENQNFIFSDVSECHSHKTRLESSSSNYGQPIEPKSTQAMPSASPASNRYIFPPETQFQSDEGQINRALAVQFRSTWEPRLVAAYVRYLPQFVTDHVGKKCSLVQKLGPQKIDPNKNLQLTSVCSDFESVLREAGEIYRIENSADYAEKATRFVKRHLLQEPLVAATQTQLNYSRALGTHDNGLSSVEKICEDLETSIAQTARAVTEEFLISLQISKSFVDEIFESVYTEARRKKLNTLMTDSADEIKTMVESFVKDPEKRLVINQEFDKIHLNWPKPPEPASYSQGPLGLLELDPEKTDFLEYDRTLLAEKLGDPYLSEFSVPNAKYFPTVIIGKHRRKEGIEILPFFLQVLDDDLPSLSAIVSHEVSHKLSPTTARFNGHEISVQLKELFNCFKNNSAIRMTKLQEDETIGDYFAAEDLAKKIFSLPEVERKEQVLKSMKGFCMLNSFNVLNYSFNPQNTHPLWEYRISGIFGANPNLRLAMGCPGESKKYKSCGLNELNFTPELEIKTKKPAGKDQQKGAK